MICYIEDDDNIRELVLYTLEKMGWEACGFADTESYQLWAKTHRPELLLLDVMLPKEDGLTFLRRLRGHKDTAAIPVILVTARGAEWDKASGLDLGADDYIVKPFGMMELTARVRALLRRTVLPEPSGLVLREGPLEVDEDRHRVTADGREVTLTVREYELLTHLMRHPGRVYSREQLLDTLWGPDYEGGTRTVDVHIQTLRTKLGDSGSRIKTIRGVGYRLGEES